MRENLLHYDEESFSSRCVRWFWSQVASAPPPLNVQHSRAEYLQFMKAEILRQSPAYAKGRVCIHGLEHLLAALDKSNVILGLLHHGSWLLIGGVIRHVLNLPYAVIASRRNFDVMRGEEVRFWRYAHLVISAYYESPLFYSDQSQFKVLRWMKPKPRILGIALDVREYDQPHKESEITFAGNRLWVQTGPAKFARVSRSKIVPAGIHYDAVAKIHHLEFHEMIDPLHQSTDQETTQKVFTSLENNYTSYMQQGFGDLIKTFSVPHKPK